MHLWYKFKEFSRFSENLTSGHWDLNSSEIFSTFTYGMYFKILPQLILKIFRMLDLCPWGQSIWEWNSSETRSTYSMNLDMLHGLVFKLLHSQDIQKTWPLTLNLRSRSLKLKLVWDLMQMHIWYMHICWLLNRRHRELLNWAICEPMYTKWSSSSFSLSQGPFSTNKTQNAKS